VKKVVLFHFVLWTFLPVGRIRSRGRGALAGYVALSTAAVVSFLSLSPLGVSGIRLGVATFTLQFFVCSYAHILLSFALSDADPDWAVRFFRGAVPYRTAPG
jgi:hypothetical protein